MKAAQSKGIILIIDDEINISRLLELYLDAKGFEVFTVCQAELADGAIDLKKPDLIFLDYRMSPITGKDILERMRVRGVETPVVMMSAYKRRNGDTEMKKLGALTYLPKPFDFADIDKILNMVFHL